MKKSALTWAGILFVSVLGLALCIEAKDTGKIVEHRSDLITIDTLKSFGDLERPEVIFLHDLHTEALEKNNKDCSTCHLSEKSSKDRLSFKFKRLEDTDKKQVMDIYHAECMGCHKEISASGQTSGPIEVCGQCHKENTRLISSRLPMAFDKSLHFRHTEAHKDEKTNKGNCALCHHEYDETAKKLFYAKDKEGSCRYCHMKETQDNRMSIRLAAHSGCIDCHKKAVAEKKKTGPIRVISSTEALRQTFRQWAGRIYDILEVRQPDRDRALSGIDRLQSYRWNVVEIYPRIFFETYVLGNWGHAFTDAKVRNAWAGYCFGMRDHFSILYNGDVCLCCVDFDGQTAVGNLHNHHCF